LKAKYPQADNVLAALLADVENNEKDSDVTDLSQDYKMEKLTKAVDVLQKEINLLKGDKKLNAVKEKAKPDFLDLDKDGDKKEPMKKAGKHKKEVCATEAYNPETGRDPNVDTTEWDDLIASAKKKQEKEYANSEAGKRDPAYRHYHQYKTQDEEEKELFFNYEDIGGNIIVNPKSTIEDQIFELLNRYYDISASEFDPSKIEIQETIAEAELNEFLPAIAGAAALGYGAYKGAKALGNWIGKKKATADTMPGNGMAKSAAKDLENHNSQMKKNLAALKSEGEFSKKVKEAAEADADAVAARDDFIKMVSSKPKSSNKAIDTIKQIVADKQNMQVKFDDGKMKVDLYTASAVSQVYDAVGTSTQGKLDDMLRTKEGMLKLSNFAFSKLNEALGGNLNEAKEAGQLNEVLPLIPLAIGAARVLGPLVARQIAKHGLKKTLTNLPKIASRLKPGAKWKTAKQIYKKSPLKKTTAAASALDYKMGPGNLVHNIDNFINNAPNNANTKANNAQKDFHTNMWTRDGKLASETRAVYSKDGELITEYTGKDAVTDKNGKAHDPKSTQGKTIINMKCNNPNVKDKTGCGTAKLGKKEKKRVAGAILKKGADMAVTGVKKLGKGAGEMMNKSGFGNPFDLKQSKYSPEDKAIEMMKEATNKVNSK
jgi:hypothetical protein